MKKLIIFLIVSTVFILASGSVFAQEEQKPRIGCQSCHFKDNFSLVDEFKGVEDHPKKTPDGKTMNVNTKLKACMECHATNTWNGKGVKAPASMDAIVHPAHLFSKTFQEELNGNCFSCHVVIKRGTFGVVSEKLQTDEHGVPKDVPVKTIKSSYLGMIYTAVIILIAVIAITLIIAITALVVAIRR